CLLRKVRDRARRLVVLLAVIGFEFFAIGRRQARIADHLPGRLVAVAAVDRIGEEPLHRDLQQRIEEHVGGKTRELRLAGFHGLERSLAIGLRQAVEVLAVGLSRPLIGLVNAGTEELARIERELIAELGLALDERTIAIEPRAAAVGAGKLAID